MDNLHKYSTLPLRRKKKKVPPPTSSDDSTVPASPKNGGGTPSSTKKSIVDKAKRKMSRSSKEIPVAEIRSKKSALSKDIEKLQNCEKSVMAALTWFVDVVEKNILVMLPRSTGQVLQEVMELTNHVTACVSHQESLSARHSELNKNLAKLILWADKVVLRGRPEDGDSAKDITNVVRGSIKSLVESYMVKLSEKEQRLQVNDNKPKRTSLPPQSPTGDPPSTLPDPSMVHGSTVDTTVDYNSNSHRDARSVSLPNPSHPPGIPLLPVRHASPEHQFLGSSPPDLGGEDTADLAPPIPPKKNERSSMFEFPTSPMASPVHHQHHHKDDFLDRSFSGSSLSVMSRTSQQSHQSNYSSVSAHSNASTASSYHSAMSSVMSSDFSSRSTLESNFLTAPGSNTTTVEHRSSIEHHRSCSSEQFTHFFVAESCNDDGRSRSAADLVESRPRSAAASIPVVEVTDPALPPPLPRKEKKKYRERKLSDYDNVDPSEADEIKQRCELLQDEETLGEWAIGDAPFHAPGEDDRRNSSGYGSVPTLKDEDDETPPPLPPKIKHIDTYLDLLGGYSENQFHMAYYHEQRHAEYVETAGEYSLHNRENFFNKSYNYNSRFPKSPRNSYGSSIETSSEGSYEGSLEGLPPALPLKQKDINMSPERRPLRSRVNTNPETPSSRRPELKKKSESLIENGDNQDLRSITGGGDMILPDCDLPDSGEPTLLDRLSISDYLIKNTEEEEPHIKGGPIDALIVFAADIDRKELVLSEVFLSTYRTVIPPHTLLNKLLYRYKRFRNKSDIKSKQANRNAFFLLLRIAGELIGQVEDNILEMLMSLVFQLLSDGELMLAKILRERVLTKIENNKKQQMMTHKQPISSLEVSMSQHTLLDFRSSEMAEQMTLMDSELFSKIEVPEVLLWAREQSEKLSPNLTIFTEHFNKMSFWVRSLILQETKAQDREKIFIKFIKLMKHLRKMNNFNSYLAVLSALDSAPVRRLDWQKQNVEALKEYSSLIDSSSSFKCYRDALAAAEPPCIPYLGLILQDMTFVHIGNPDLLPDTDHVNFIKCWQFFNIMDSMRRFKQTQYDNLKKDDRILAFFNDFTDCLDEEAMWQLSKEIKPQTRGRANKSN